VKSLYDKRFIIRKITVKQQPAAGNAEGMEWVRGHSKCKVCQNKHCKSFLQLVPYHVYESTHTNCSGKYTAIHYDSYNACIHYTASKGIAQFVISKLQFLVKKNINKLQVLVKIF